MISLMKGSNTPKMGLKSLSRHFSQEQFGKGERRRDRGGHGEGSSGTFSLMQKVRQMGAPVAGTAGGGVEKLRFILL